jgi:Na+-driven multidrug efflux pump
VLSFGLATLVMAGAVFRSRLRPGRGDWMMDKRLFADILRVGGLSVLNAFQTVLTAVALTGFVGRFGAAALAGYGVGVRLELLQIPLVFAVGQALVVLVGTNIGAGNAPRAKRIAWIGAGLAGAICLVIGWTFALLPLGWVGLFSTDAEVLDAGTRYLRIVAPFYPLIGVNVALYFASQGAGRMLMPVLAGTTRLVIVLVGGAMVVSLGAIFGVVALGITVWGALMILIVARTTWKT